MNVRVLLLPEGGGGGGYRLEGPLAEEVRQLAGFRLTVEGVPGEASPPEGRSLHVERYEIHSPWGTPLTVGEVSSAEGERVVVREEGGADVLLLLPEGAVQLGQKVWVEPVDPSAPEPRRALRYGVLRR